MCRTDLTSTLTKQSAKLMHPVNPLSGNAHIYYFTLPTNGQMILPIKGVVVFWGGLSHLISIALPLCKQGRFIELIIPFSQQQLLLNIQ